jgi:hypothetical protein
MAIAISQTRCAKREKNVSIDVNETFAVIVASIHECEPQ